MWLKNYRIFKLLKLFFANFTSKYNNLMYCIKSWLLKYFRSTRFKKTHFVSESHFYHFVQILTTALDRERSKKV